MNGILYAGDCLQVMNNPGKPLGLPIYGARRKGAALI